MATGTKKGSSACQSGQTAFAARLLGRFAAVAAADNNNLIFSPLSIHVALALMSTGASGDTLAEILAVAGAPSREELRAFVRAAVIDRVLADQSGAGGPIVAFACGAWTDRRVPLRPEYHDTIVGTFKGSATTVDFKDKPVESRVQINAWVAEVTRGLITEMGKWRDPFSKEHTIDHQFHRLDGSTIDVPFMQIWCDQKIACYDGFKVLKLPYKTMDVDRASPDFDWTQLNPQSLIEKMTSSPNFLHDHLPSEFVPVNEFRLPRFKLTYGGSIVEDLESLGLILPFHPLTANVSEITEVDTTDDGPIYVSDVIHKAVVDVNEEGSDAAAATESDDDCGFSLDYEPPKQVDFVADHPFAFFMIEETSGSIIFAGHVLDPSRE
ncbi:hypothetical protein C2845_PM17G06490 [Panicum miliaceum]|uniref:Serpin domain-containing protein n=1 Tax=Panicum miliaceum TaxID=4540 RepID=A0A3L6PZG0_PANMI|nr:hypothetical protein C2845_PM17G06490 [Panicum miliaceum]